VELRKNITHDPGRYARHDEHGRHLAEYHEEGVIEPLSLGRMHKRHDDRHKKGHSNIDQHRICDNAGHVPAKLSGNHRTCSGRRTDHAEHHRLDSVPEGNVRK